MATADMGKWWRLSRTGTAGETLRGAASFGTRWGFVGADSGSPLIYTAVSSELDDLAPTYTKRTPAGTDDLYDIDYVSAENTAIAIGSNGTVEQSTNLGDSWSQLNLTPPGNDLYGIVGLTGSATALFVAVGVDIIWGRTDAGVWSSRWTGSQTWRSVAYLSGVGWVAVGDGGKGTHSATAASLSFAAPFAIAPSDDLVSVAANNTYFVAVGDDGIAYRSTDGLAWQGFTIDGGTPFAVVEPLATSNDWAAVTAAGVGWVSEDNGQRWTQNSGSGADNVQGGRVGPNRSAIAGTTGRVWVSFDQEQTDPPAGVTPPAPPPAFGANDDMSLEAIRRLSTQFRS